MAKITNSAREDFNDKVKPYKDEIDKILAKEKAVLSAIDRDSDNAAYKKILLAEDMIYVATVYLTMSNLSLEILSTKNTDSLNESRKALYKAIIYLEEVVTSVIDAPYSEYEDALSKIVKIPLEKRFFIIRKLGLAIHFLVDAYGENTKWKWAFVELNGRFAVVAKNFMDIKVVSKAFFDPGDPNYDISVHYIRLVRKLIAQSVDAYHEKYEFSTHRIDDMRNALLFISAQRRFCIIFDEKEEAEELKKKGRVLKEKLELDRKKGIAQ